AAAALLPDRPRAAGLGLAPAVPPAPAADEHRGLALPAARGKGRGRPLLRPPRPPAGGLGLLLPELRLLRVPLALAPAHAPASEHPCVCGRAAGPHSDGRQVLRPAPSRPAGARARLTGGGLQVRLQESDGTGVDALDLVRRGAAEPMAGALQGDELVGD